MIALTACVMPRAATLSSASFASEKPQKRDDTSKKAIQMASTNSVPTNFTSRRTYGDWRRSLCGCARVMRMTTAERKNATTSSPAVAIAICSTFSDVPMPASVATTEAPASSSIGNCQSDATISNVSVAARRLCRCSYERLRIRCATGRWNASAKYPVSTAAPMFATVEISPDRFVPSCWATS